MVGRDRCDACPHGLGNVSECIDVEIEIQLGRRPFCDVGNGRIGAKAHYAENKLRHIEQRYCSPFRKYRCGQPWRKYLT